MINLRLMERDHAILHDLKCFHVMSLEQIRRRHFAKVCKSVCSERLTKMHKEGIVLKQRVGILMHQRHPKEVGSVVTLTSKGARILQENGKTFTKEFYPRVLNTAELPHDLLLVELVDVLKKKLPSCEIQLGTRGRTYGGTALRVPDLTVSLTGKEQWAVELELTAKSSRRYRHILLDYLTSDYDKVLYVVGSPAIQLKLQRILNEYKNSSQCRFKFTLLDEFLDGSGEKIPRNISIKEEVAA